MSTKVAVIGAGISGICSAIAVSKNGADVTIIEKSASIGGIATKTNVGTFCGVFLTSSQDPKLVGNRTTQRFLKEIIALDDSHKPIEHSPGLFVIPYNFEIVQEFLNQKVEAHSIHVFQNTTISSVRLTDKAITSLILIKNKIKDEYHFDAIIDCTGNATIARLINHPVLENKIYQSASRVFYINNVKAKSERSLQLYLSLAQQRVSDKNMKSKALLCSIIPGSFQKNQTGIKLNLPWNVKEIEGNLPSYLSMSKNLILETFSWLKNNIEAFENSSISKIFDDIGFRSSSRTLGQKILTKSDLTINDIDDPAAIGAWPIEKWDADGKVTLEMADIVKSGYSIPKGCLIAAEIDNLFMAGKNISADEEAIASARVMGTCIQTGFSAGIMASSNKKQG